MNSTIVEIVLASQDAVVALDVDTYLSFLATDVILRSPTAPPVEGLEQAREHVAALFGMLSKLEFLDRKVFSLGLSAAMRSTLRITTRSGRVGTLDGIDVFELDEHQKIKQVVSYFDPSVLGRLFVP